MLPLLAPILAQLVTLNLADRTESRYVATQPRHFEAETRPATGLTLDFKRTSLSAFYSPSLLYVPRLSDERPANLLVFHTGAVSAAFNWRYTKLSVFEGVGFGERDLGADALGAGKALAPATTTPPPAPTNPGDAPAPVPAPAPGTPPANTPTDTGVNAAGAQAPAFPRIVKLVYFTSGVSVVHRPTAATSIKADAAYTVSGGMDAASRTFYPRVHGPLFGAGVAQRVTLIDTLTTAASAQYSTNSQFGFRTWIFLANERLEHSFSRRTSGRVGAGISVTRTSQSDGLIGYGVYPTFELGINHARRLNAGMLSLAAGLNSAPALDPIRAAVDPRIGALGSIGWGRNRFSIVTAAWSAISLEGGNNSSAFNSVNGSAVTAYRFAKELTADFGIRYAYQSYGGQAVVPFGYAVFLGVAFGAAVPLNGRAR